MIRGSSGLTPGATYYEQVGQQLRTPSRTDSDHSDLVSPMTGLLEDRDRSVARHRTSHDLTGMLLRAALAVSILSFAVSAAVAAGLYWGYLVAASAANENRRWPAEALLEAEANSRDKQTRPEGGHCFGDMLRDAAAMGREENAFRFITGTSAHKLPPMYGRVREKTIWVFWYDLEHCPYSRRCHMPAYIQLCLETIRRNKGSFDLHVLHADTVDHFVSLTELPVHWSILSPRQKKDALMNALLARYGGVALDISTVLFRPLDQEWDEVVNSGATFRGYMYRLNGRPWMLPEVTGTWFLMSRREGIFSTAVRNQRVSMCLAHQRPNLALGDFTLTPVLSMFNYTLPKCYEDQAVKNRASCPEFAQPIWGPSATGPARNDRKLLLSDPRAGPQLPFARLDESGTALWQTDDTASLRNSQLVRGPSQVQQLDLELCGSMKECWHDIFLHRLNTSAPFVKIFNHREHLPYLSLRDILSRRNSYLYNWLKLAGLPKSQLDPSGFN
eukprot:CAMPEP_0172663954 /NCGR_PEP_ID=MMETSP1074-20121228/6273_1 /TAXON_ID=2916 /ORGANISM="Ceratium fusus, Strain PA161109" /LENGTH=500 /DNA_ID=CAMNT_0013480027 /DNA_START=90 /DNA_END=1592 /DNA_ORIENTATION=+